jgi:hypothetical protein
MFILYRQLLYLAVKQRESILIKSFALADVAASSSLTCADMIIGILLLLLYPM